MFFVYQTVVVDYAKKWQGPVTCLIHTVATVQVENSHHTCVGTRVNCLSCLTELSWYHELHTHGKQTDRTLNFLCQ